MKYYIGIDLGGTNIAVGIVEDTGRLITKHSEPTHAEKTFEELVSDIAKAAYEAVRISGLTSEDIFAVGMGTPSCINPRTGLLVNANNLNWINVPLLEEMKKHFSMPVYIQNDAACAALGEAISGAAADYEDVLLVTLGTGVGGGIILNKKVFNGCDSMGAEIGHTKLVYDGIPCTCGQRGCFESYASATALIRQTKEAMKNHPESILHSLCDKDESKVNAKMLFDAAQLGDKVAMKVLDTYIDYLAAGLSSLIAVFRPQAVIIGGGVSGAGEALMNPLREKLFANTFAAEQIGLPHLDAARLGNDAGIIGAAMLCCER